MHPRRHCPDILLGTFPTSANPLAEQLPGTTFGKRWDRGGIPAGGDSSQNEERVSELGTQDARNRAYDGST